MDKAATRFAQGTTTSSSHVVKRLVVDARLPAGFTDGSRSSVRAPPRSGVVIRALRAVAGARAKGLRAGPPGGEEGAARSSSRCDPARRKRAAAAVGWPGRTAVRSPMGTTLGIDKPADRPNPCREDGEQRRREAERDGASRSKSSRSKCSRMTPPVRSPPTDQPAVLHCLAPRALPNRCAARALARAHGSARSPWCRAAARSHARGNKAPEAFGGAMKERVAQWRRACSSAHERWDRLHPGLHRTGTDHLHLHAMPSTSCPVVADRVDPFAGRGGRTFVHQGGGRDDDDEEALRPSM